MSVTAAVSVPVALTRVYGLMESHIVEETARMKGQDGGCNGQGTSIFVEESKEDGVGGMREAMQIEAQDSAC